MTADAGFNVPMPTFIQRALGEQFEFKYLRSFPTAAVPKWAPHDVHRSLVESAWWLSQRANQNFAAPRMCFQWYWVEWCLKRNGQQNGRPQVLNVGCADDPAYFGSLAMHYDIDDWSKCHEHFVQGNAEHLPFASQSFDTVIMADIHEHMKDPLVGSLESARVAETYVVWSIFEELRLPSRGQHITLGQQMCDESSQKDGYADRFDAQAKISLLRVGAPDDDKTPHLAHINRFEDKDIDRLIQEVVNRGFELEVAVKIQEVPAELGAKGQHHDWWNWLTVLRRV